MQYILIFLVTFIIIEIKYKPRFDFIKDNYFNYLIVFYSSKTKFGSIKREFFKLLKIKN